MAALLFLENGYAGTSLEAIAAKTKIGKHTLYRRFPDKRTLFAAVMKRGSADVEAVAEPRAGLTPLENLRALITAAVETLTRPYALQFMRMVIAEGTRFPELAQEYSRNADDSIVQAAEKLIGSAHDVFPRPAKSSEIGRYGRIPIEFECSATNCRSIGSWDRHATLNVCPS
jgi:AcrR family transcriptional regulator